MMKIMSKKVNTWSYLYARQKAIPVLGSFHALDVFTEVPISRRRPVQHTSDKVTFVARGGLDASASS